MAMKVIYQTCNSEQCKELEEEVNEILKNYTVITSNNYLLAEKDGKITRFSPYKKGFVKNVLKRDGSEGGKLEFMTKEELCINLEGKKYFFDLSETEE